MLTGKGEEKAEEKKIYFPLFLLREGSDSNPEEALNGLENDNEGEMEFVVKTQSRSEGGGETSGIVSCASVWVFRTAEFQEEIHCNPLLKPFITELFSFKKCWFNGRALVG